MIKRILSITAIICIITCLSVQMPVYASDGQEYITISVDAVDENGNLKYALDTDDPSAFTDSNEFVVPAGTSHTIYVKDTAGNISSQMYTAENEDTGQYISNDTSTIEEGGQRINIDLEIGEDTSAQEEYEIIDNPAEPGTASVSSKVKTDGSDSAEKVFYNFTTKEGETLYLVIDQGQGSDNVYLLDTVSLEDLKVLADGQADSYRADSENKEDNLLAALSASDDVTTEIADEPGTVKPDKSSRKSNAAIVLIIAAVGGGAYYYLKVYKNKKEEAMDAMDAMDMDEFEPEEEEEEIDFDYDDAEKERYLEELVSGEEDLYEANPDEYAMSHMYEEDEGNCDVGIELDENDDESESDGGIA